MTLQKQKQERIDFLREYLKKHKKINEKLLYARMSSELLFVKKGTLKEYLKDLETLGEIEIKGGVVEIVKT